MALNYLLSPEFQIVNSAGRPASGGYLEVYYHGTRDRYYCASDFDGTLHPFQVPLDSLGGNVVLADDSHAYDVYIYNRYGSLLMSRYNIHPSSGGSMGGVITSSDGSVTVTPTQDGWDLSVDDGKAATFRAAADSLSADGYFSFRKIEGEGDAIYLDNGQIKMDDGWYHFSATVKLTWYGSNVNDTSTVRLYSGATYDVIDFDYSYNHSDTVVLDGDIWIGAHSTHYISFGRNFSLGVTGMRQGMVAELVDCDLHSIIGQGVGGNGEKNIHRLLRYYTNESEADAQHPVGDWLHDLDAEDPSDPSGHPMVTADQLFEWYDEGQIFELYEVDGSNGQLGWSAVYRMVTWQDQSDWWSQYAPVPGKACRLEFYRMGGYSSVNRGMMIAYIRYKEEDYMRLYQIMPGQDVWTMDFQPELTAGSNISISGSTISATDTTYTAGTGLSLTGTEFSADTSVLATQSDLAGKQDTLTAGSNITISNNVISATDTTYTAGSGIDITGDVISADTSVVATQSDLAGKQDTLTAGTGITIQNNVISATAAQQVQSNWNETDTADPSYIQNKPDLSIYAESANLATVATTGDYDDLLNKPSIPSFDSTQMAAINSGVNSTKVGNYDAHIADTDIHVTTSDKSTWNAKQDAISDLNTIRSGAQAGSTAVQPGDLAEVATTGSYDDLTNKPTIPAAQVQSDWSESDSSAVSYIQNKPSNLVQDASYVHTDENFTSAEKTKLAGIESGAEVNVQSDWNESDSSSDAYIQNKPTIPAAQVNSDWNASSGVAQILNKPDLSVYATQSDLNGKQDTLTAGSNISISNNTISATDTTYTAGTGLSLTGTTFAADTTVLATKSDLAGKQDTLTFSNPLKNVSNTVSLAYDTHTLSASTTTERTVATFRGAYEGGVYIPILSFMDQGDVGESLDQGSPYSSITVHIPGNTFEFSWFDTSSRAAGLELGVTQTFNNSSEAVRYLTPVSVTEDQNTGYMVVDEQDVVLPLPASNSTYWTAKGFNFLSSATRYLVFARYDIGSTRVSNQFARLVDNTVEPVVTMSTSVTMAGPLTVKDPIPTHTSSDSGKVLGVDSNGDLEWTAGGGGAGGADWDATSGEPGYIENKPTPKVLTAGTNISISETASALTISATAAPQVQSDWTESDSSEVSYIQHKPVEKTLAAGNGITLTEANDVVTVAATPYTAGTGISISNNVISSGYNETLLWSSDTAASSFTLSEGITNFERLKLLMQYNGMKMWCDGTVVSASQFTVACCGYANNSGDGNRLQIFGGSFTSSNGTTFASEAGKCIYFANGSAAIGGGATSACTFLKIYGVNRVASN